MKDFLVSNCQFSCCAISNKFVLNELWWTTNREMFIWRLFSFVFCLSLSRVTDEMNFFSFHFYFISYSDLLMDIGEVLKRQSKKVTTHNWHRHINTKIVQLKNDRRTNSPTVENNKKTSIINNLQQKRKR